MRGSCGVNLLSFHSASKAISPMTEIRSSQNGKNQTTGTRGNTILILLILDRKKGEMMRKVVFNMTMSLDGFVAGPNDNPDNGLGDGGEALFNWYFSGDTEVKISEGTPVLKVSRKSAKILKDSIKRYGAGVWGRRTFDIARAWGGYPPGSPAYIVT